MTEQDPSGRAGSDADAAATVLVLCAANQCRSPFVAARLGAVLRDGDPAIEIRSAGLRAADGAGVGEGLARIFTERGLDLSGHRSAGIAEEDLRADLVIVMEHHQLAEIVVDHPDAWPRTFTLRELVRRSSNVAPRAAGERLDEWVARVHAGRRRLELVGAWDEDVPDPAGQPREVLERTLDELEDLVDELGTVMVPPR